MTAVDTEYQPHEAFARWRSGRFGGAGVLNQTWMDQIERDPNLQNVILGIQLAFGTDYEVRVGTKQFSTSSSDGSSYSFAGSLGGEPSITWAYQPGNASSSTNNISASIPNALVDLKKLMGAGRVLAGVAEVALYIEGGSYESRLILLSGDITDLEFGHVDEIVNFTINEPREAVDQSLPPYVLSTQRHSTLIAASEGAALAIAMEEYEYIPCHALNNSTTLPNFAVCHDHLTISAVYVDGVSYPTTSSIYPWSQVHTVDRLGTPYTQINFTGGSGTFDGEGGEKVYASVTDGPTNGNVVQIIQRIVEHHTTITHSGANLDLFARAEARAGFLPAQVAANASGSGNQGAISFIEGSILESFPMISMAWFHGRYGPVFTDRQDRRSVTPLIADQWPVFDREGPVREVSKVDCYNSFSIRYSYDALADEFAKYTERNPRNNALCELSRSIIGERHADQLESIFIHDDAAAERVLDWCVAHMAIPGYDVAYAVSTSLGLRLMLGDNVELTDPEFDWVDEIATIISITWQSTHCSIVLRVWNDKLQLAGAPLAVPSYSGGQ